METFVKLLNLSFLLVAVAFINGCQSTPDVPDWALTIPAADEMYFYANGQGRSMNQAKKVAANQINEQLWTQIEAKTTQKEVVRGVNGKENYQNLFSSNIRSKSALITLNGIEYIKSESDEGLHFVQARIKKNTIKSQLLREIEEINKQAKQKLDALKHSDRLMWWIENKDSKKMQQELAIRVSMMAVFESGNKYSTDSVDKLIKTLAEVKSSLLIKVSKTPKENKVNLFLTEALTADGIQFTTSNNKNITHSILISIEKRKNKMDEAYIITSVIELRVVNNKGKMLSSSEVIATGNSLSGYKYSSEGSARHFKQQLDEAGIWSTLGLKH